jgi:hypothetical protein
MANALIRQGLIGLGGLGRKSGKGAKMFAEMQKGGSGVGDFIANGARAQMLMKMGKRRAAVGGAALALGMGSSRGTGRGATGNGYMPVGTSSGGQGY